MFFNLRNGKVNGNGNAHGKSKEMLPTNKKEPLYRLNEVGIELEMLPFLDGK